MNKKLTLKQVLILFLIVLSALITMAVLAYNRLSSLVESNEIINRNNEFAFKLEEVVSCLKDAESGSRGFLLTSDTEFLLAQKRAGTVVFQNLVDIRKEFKMIDEQIPYIDSIQRMAKSKIDNVWSMVHSIKTRKVEPLTEYQIKLIAEGKFLMDSLQITIKNLKGLQQKQLKYDIDKQREFAESSPRFLRMLLMSAIAIILITMCVIFWQLLIVEKAKKRLEEKIDELNKANRELDQYAFTLTHHLQEPLRKIRLFSSRYENKLKKASDTEGVKSLQKISNFAADSQELCSVR